MKALIVDDEKHVREAILLLVDWATFNITETREAVDGETAITMILDWKPEIIFTDMKMPGIDGCELLTWIQEHAPNSKTIVISGHDDFQYVRHSMTAGSIDYILKPIDADQLESAVQQAVNIWQEEASARMEHQSHKIEVNLLKPIYREKMFTDLIQQPDIALLKRKDILQEFPSLANTSQISCAIIHLNPLASVIQRKYENHRDLLFFTLTNICNEFLKEPSIGFAFRYWSSEDEIVVLYWNDQNQIEELMINMNQAFLTTLGAQFDIGISSRRAFPSGMLDAYQDAKTALLQRNVTPLDRQIYLFGETTDARSDHGRDIIAEIQAYIETHYNADLSLRHISTTFYLSREYISRRFKQKIGVNISDYVEQIRIKHAKQHIMNSNLKIAQIAQMVGYQDDKYFSRVFKKITGLSPNDFRHQKQKNDF